MTAAICSHVKSIKMPEYVSQKANCIAIQNTVIKFVKNTMALYFSFTILAFI